MTKKRTLRKAIVQGYDPAQADYVVDLLYPDGRPNIQQIRDWERRQIQPLQVPGATLPNPNVQAPFGRMSPQTRLAKNEALGFQVQPNRLIDLAPGDAGAGESSFRRTQIFARLDSPSNLIVAGNPYDKSIGMATQRSSDARPRFWHVSFFGIAVQRVANPPATLTPLSEGQILSAQLEPVITGAISTPNFVPAISQMKGRVMVFDESGQRFFDVDVLGNRSFDVYAWGVTAFILMPGNADDITQTSYEVDRGSDGNIPQAPLSGLIEDALIGVRVVPIAVNSTQNDENRTITAVTDGINITRVPIPPGARKVQVISHESSTLATSYDIRFDAGNDGTFIGRSDLGIIDINAGETKSDVILIPNAVQIIFTPPAPPPPPVTAGWSLVFTVESQ